MQPDQTFNQSLIKSENGAINPLHNPAANKDALLDDSAEILTITPSFWTMISIISHSFFPIYFIELTKSGINATNTSILASEGENEAAAIAFISSTVVLYCVAFPAINFYLFNLLGNKDNERKQDLIIFDALLLNLFFGCLVGLASYFTGDFLQLIGTSPDIADIVSDFYSVFAFAVPSIFLFLAWQVISVATGKRNIAFISSTIALFSSIMWTVSTCVIQPDAIAISPAKLTGGSYVIGYSLGTLFYLSYFIFNHLLVLPSYERFMENLPLLKEWVSKGAYAVGHISCELLSLILQSILVVAQMNCSVSDLATIAFLNFWNLNTVTFAIAMGLATNDQMNKVLENDNRDEIRTAYGNAGLRICITLNCIVLVTAMISPETLVNTAGVHRNDIDLDNNRLRLFFLIQSLGLAANSRRDVLPGILRSNDIVKTPMIASLIAQAFGLICQYSLGVVAGWGVLGLQVGYYGGLALGDFYLECVWHHNSKPEVAKENRESPSKLALVDSFTGQFSSVVTYFKKAGGSVKNYSPCLRRS